MDFECREPGGVTANPARVGQNLALWTSVASTKAEATAPGFKSTDGGVVWPLGKPPRCPRGVCTAGRTSCWAPLRPATPGYPRSMQRPTPSLRKSSTTPQVPWLAPALRSLMARSANAQRAIPAAFPLGETDGEVVGTGVPTPQLAKTPAARAAHGHGARRPPVTTTLRVSFRRFERIEVVRRFPARVSGWTRAGGRRNARPPRGPARRDQVSISVDPITQTGSYERPRKWRLWPHSLASPAPPFAAVGSTSGVGMLSPCRVSGYPHFATHPKIVA